VSRFLSIVLMILAITSSAFSQSAEDRRTTLKINLGAEPETFDPSMNQSVIGGRVIRGLMEGLIGLDGDSQPIPAGAASWEHNDDYTVWTFQLQPNAKWHDGTPVTSTDYAYGIKRVLTKRLAAEYAKTVLSALKDADKFYAAGGLDSAEAFTAVEERGPHTVVYHLAYPMPYFPSVVDLSCWFPINRKTAEANGDAWWQKPETYIGNGPFRMSLYRPKDHVAMTKADTYWDKDSIFWKKVEFYFIESLNTESLAFSTGDLDITYRVMLGDVERWRGKPEFTPWTMFGTYYLDFNTKVAPFTDARVRRAFSICIDRKRLTDRLLRRGEVVSGGIIPETLPSPRGGTFREHAGDLIGPRNVEEARRLIAEAGYGPDNPLPAVEYLYDSLEDHKMIGEQLQAMWKEALGVDVRLQPVDWSIRLQRARKGEFQIVRSGWYGDYMDAMTFIEMFETGNEFNRPKMSNARYDELVKLARNEKDQVKREDHMIEAERILVKDECAIMPILTYSNPILVNPNIEGLVRNSLGSLNFQRARRK